MNQIEAALAESNKTILEMQLRLCNAAAQIAGLQTELEEARKPKDGPKLESVKDEAA